MKVPSDFSPTSPYVCMQNVHVEFPFHQDAVQGIKSVNTIENDEGQNIDSQSGAPFIKRGSKYYAAALSRVNLSLQSGDRVGIIGHNGSGKSTLLRVISGVLEPSQGIVSTQGWLASTMSTTFGFDMRATGRENIFRRGLMMRLSLKNIQSRIDDILEFAELGHYIDMPMGTYSKGMKARLGFAITTAVNADILVMDEWIGAGDQRFIQKCQVRLNTLIDDTKVLIIASHKEKLLRNLCNKLLILEKGCVTFHDSIDYLDEYEEIINAGLSSAKKTVSLKDKKIANLRQKIEILKEKNLYKTTKLKSLKERFDKLSKN